MKHSPNVYTVLMLAAFLSLAGVSSLVWVKMTNDYGLTPKQMLGFDKLPNPNEKAGTAGAQN